MALRDGTDVASFVERLADDDRHLADYLTEEVLDRQPGEIREFLLETSPLERLFPDLCDAVRDRDDSARILDELDHRALFTHRISAETPEYRYTSLVRDLLRMRLRATDPGRERLVLSRAAHWLADHGNPIAAGRHLVRAGATEELVAHTRRWTRTLYQHDDTATPLQWLATLGDAASASEDLALAHAFVRLTAGEQRTADTMLASIIDDPSSSEGARTVALAFRSLLVQSVLAPSLAAACAERALQRLAESDAELPEVLGLTSTATLTALCRCGLGLAALHDGRLEDGRAILDAAVAADAPASPMLCVQLLGAAAVAHAWSGRLLSAERLAHRAERLAAEHRGAHHRALADAYLALGHVARRRHELDEADAVLERAAAIARSNNRHVVSSAVVAERAAVALARAEWRSGLDLLARHATSGVPPPPRLLRSRLTAVRAQLHLRSGDLDRAGRVLADAARPLTGELAHVVIQVAVAEADWPRARKLIDDLPGGGTRRERIARDMWRAALEFSDGSATRGAHDMATVAAEAETDLDRALFLDAGPTVVAVLHAVPHGTSSGFVASITGIERPSVEHLDDLDQLSSREIDVIRYLPTRLTNAEIAEQLYISLNTLKTHLKHVYRKLGVQSRREAITAAEQLGLL